MGTAGKFLVIGSGGQVGSALCKLLGTKAIGVDYPEFNLAELESIEQNLQKFADKPVDAIINAAAYTQVDKAESEREVTRTINSLAPEVIAKFCKTREIPLVHYSTDYVYPGTGTHFMTEEEKYGPCNYYGETKREGDERIEKLGGQYLIFRTCWVYDAGGKNFLNTILRLAGENGELSIVSDQFGSPSYAGDLAKATIQALNQAMESRNFPSGIYHLCNSNVTTWRDYAEEIVKLAKEMGVKLRCNKVLTKTSEEYITPARRPKNSRLSTEKLKRVFGITMPSWQDSLKHCLREKYASK